MEEIIAAVRRLYNTYPFPPDPLSSDPPPGYNWRWSWPDAYSFATGITPTNKAIRILDAGCGTGSSTEYLSFLNPQASVVGIDISEAAIALAKERYQRSGVLQMGIPEPLLLQLNVYDLDQLPGEFDFINSVGMLHHLPDPKRGIQALAHKLAPGGILHIFVYAELGRWEIRLMQQAIGLIQGQEKGNYADGVAVGRRLFAALPNTNRLVQYEKRRWQGENQRDANFADMYVHPQELTYTIPTLFDLITASGLTFLGFSNPDYWSLERLLSTDPELLTRAQQLPLIETYHLIELLDPEITHYEFFLGKPPLPKQTWQKDSSLLAAIPELSSCLHGWPSSTLLDCNYQPLTLTPDEMKFLNACDGKQSVQAILEQIPLDLTAVRSLHRRQILLLKVPGSQE
jgi:SAM-dependent methyltransferase